MMNDKRGQVVYAALGDSTGVGVGANDGGGGYVARLFRRIESVRAGSRLLNLCVSGATTTDVLREQVEPAVQFHPTLITLGIGINDVGREMDEETFARNYEEIVLRLKPTGARLVVTNIPDISLSPVAMITTATARTHYERRIKLFNERIAEIAARHNLLLVDAYAATHETIPAHPDFFSEDGFHPSAKGYETWAEVMWPTVKTAIGE